MTTRSTFTKLLTLAVLITASTIYVANRSQASRIESAADPTPAPPASNIPKKSLSIHGPFEASSNDLKMGGGPRSTDEGPAAAVPGKPGNAGGAGEPSARKSALRTGFCSITRYSLRIARPA